MPSWFLFLLFQSILSTFIQAGIIPIPTTSCNSTCMAKMTDWRVDDIKNRVMSNLKLGHLPDMSKVRIHPGALKVLMKDLDVDDSSSTTYTESIDPYKGHDLNTLVAHFPISPDVLSREPERIQLGVYIKLPEYIPYHVELAINVRERFIDKSVSDIIVSKDVRMSKSEFVTIDMDPKLLYRMHDEPVLGLYVEAYYQGKNLAIHPQTGPVNENMFITITSNPEENGRQRRDTGICTREMEEPSCCLYDLVIDFHEIGWDFIMAPLRYNAYMCKGDCKFNFDSSALSRVGHTKLAKAGQFTRDGIMGHIGTCCHAADYDPLKLVYVNGDHEVTVSRVPGLIARRCSCS